jgi:DNA-binding Lrp family transcriptional regulator
MDGIRVHMPLQLDDYDVSILRSLLKDGRKSFREVSRETGITTPTVKARFTRLVNVGFIKSVSPIFDFSIVEKNENILKPELDKQQNKGIEDSKVIENQDHGKNNNRQLDQQQAISRFKIKRELKIKLDCEFCKGPFLALCMFTNLQLMSDFSVVQDASLVTRKNMQAE